MNKLMTETPTQKPTNAIRRLRDRYIPRKYWYWVLIAIWIIIAVIWIPQVIALVLMGRPIITDNILILSAIIYTVLVIIYTLLTAESDPEDA